MKPMIRMRSSIAVVVVAAGLGVLAVRPPTSHGTIIRTADPIEPTVAEEGGWPTTTTSTTAEAPVVSPTTTALAPSHRVQTRVATPTTLDPNEVVWIRDGRGFCGQTSRASADPTAIDSTCPSNQPAPIEGHAANPDAEDENDVVYVYENGYCKPEGRAESGQEHNSPECVGYTEGVAPYDESTTTTTQP